MNFKACLPILVILGLVPTSQGAIAILESADARTSLDATGTAAVTLAPVSAETGDMIVVVAATNKKGSVAPLVATQAGGTGSVGSQTVVMNSGDPYPTSWGWYQAVTAPGTFAWRVAVTSGSVNLVAAVYVIRADTGEVGCVATTQAATDTASSISLTYSFGSALADGVLIEAVGARSDTVTIPSGYIQTPNSWTNRKAVSFDGVSGTSATSSYGLAGGTAGIQTSSAIGMAFAELIRTDVPPEFNSDLLAKPDAVAGIAYSSTLAGDATDRNGDALTFSKTSGPGWLLVDADGTLHGTPSTGHLGLNTFTVRVEDPGGNSDTATLQVLVVEGIGLPYREPFELNAPFTTLFSVAGWASTEWNSPQVRPVEYLHGSVPITGVQHKQVLDVNGPVSANFSPRMEHPVVLLDTLLQPVLRTNPDPPEVDAAAQSAFFFNGDGRLVVRHAVYTDNFTKVVRQWTTLDNTPVAAGDWIRLAIRTDYSSDSAGDKYFTIELDGVLLASPQAYNQFTPTDETTHMGGTLFLCANSGGGAGSSGLRSVAFAGIARVDDLTVSTPASETAAGTPFEWIEARYPGSDYAAVALLDLDGDGMTTDAEYRAGTDPNDPSSVLHLAMNRLPHGEILLTWPSSFDGALTPYHIQRSADLGAWTTVEPAILRDLSGTNLWMETPDDGSPAFYRLMY